MKTDIRVIIKEECFEILKVSTISHNFPTHVHDRICVGKITDGEKTLTIEGRSRLLKENDLFYIPAYTPHSCYVDNGKSVSYTVFAFNREKIDYNDDFERYAEELLGADSVLFYQNHSTSEGTPKKRDGLVREVLEIIENDYSENISAKKIAESVGISQYHLLHKFKEALGISFHQYLLQKRIKKSKEGFSTVEKALDVALSCGFYDQSHFIRNFKKYEGTTPNKYKQAISYL